MLLQREHIKFMSPIPLIDIEVVFTQGNYYKILSLQVEAGTTIEQAIQYSGILAFFPNIRIQNDDKEGGNRVGIFGKLKALEEVVQANDRIEIYQPLGQTAIESRRARLKKQKTKRQIQVRDRD